MREMKDSGIEWIGKIPKEWKVGKVKDVFIRKNEKAKQENPVVLSLARSGVKIRDITKGEGQLAENYSNYNPVEKGDFLLNPMDLYSGANCSTSEVNGVISPAYINLRAKGNNNSKYYDYYFKTQYWAMALFAHGKGVSFENRWTLGVDAVMNYFIPVPKGSEQDKISKFLDEKITEIDNVIAKTKQTIEDYKLYKQGIISKAVTKGLDNEIAMKESNCKWVDKIPNNWEIINTKRFFSFGKGLPITKDNLVEEGAKVINYGQIHSKLNTGMGISNGLIKHVNNKFFKTNSQSLTKLGDFIFADTSEDLEGCGNAIFVDQANIFAGYHTIILSPKNKCFNKYFAYLFMSDLWRSQIRSRVSGIKLFSITQAILNETTVIVPSMQEQEKITNYLDERCSVINKLIISKEKNIEDLEKYKKSLIYEYVTGKKEVI